MINKTRSRILFTLLTGLTAAMMAIAPAAAQEPSGTSPSRSVAARRPRPAPYVSLNVQNAPVRLALERLFQEARRDYVIAHDVSGVISMQVTRRPFSEALRLLLNNASPALEMEQESGIFLIRRKVTEASENGGKSVARNEAASKPTEETEETDAAPTENRPGSGYYGGWQIGGEMPRFSAGIPGYPGIGLPTNGFGNAFTPYQYPVFFVEPLAGPGFFQAPVLSLAPGVTVFGAFGATPFGAAPFPVIPNGGFFPSPY
ncbi:MAG: hypothetical protein SFU56_16795 [Capsulimonadales bacterium]|nr:hypothetical protein [Capsulimonadales bacterium]